MKYRLVAIDMDGTLLNSENHVTDRTREALNKAMEKGVYIILSTGRILKSALYYSDELGLNNPMITCNGAIIVDEDKNVVFEKSIEKEVVSKIMDILDSEDIYYHFYDKEKFYSKEKVEEILRFYNESGSTFTVDMNTFDNKDEVLSDEDISTYKFIFIDDDREKLNNLRSELDKMEGVETSSSWINNIEAMASGVSKGNAIGIMCDRLGVSLDEVIAIGDGENDLSMLTKAGLGVAMGNASEFVKSHADCVTDTNDQDGVAKVIEKYILD